MTTALDKLKRTKWFRDRPLVVQKAYDIWSPGDSFLVDGKSCYCLGHTETEDSDKSGDPYDLMLILSEFDPIVDYDKARANIFRICAKHFKKATVQ